MNATHTVLKSLNPKSADTKYVGLEPTWRVQPTDNRISTMSYAFGWYNYFYGKKEAKDMVEGVPSVVKEAAPKAEAESIKKQLEEAGAKVDLK